MRGARRIPAGAALAVLLAGAAACQAPQPTIRLEEPRELRISLALGPAGGGRPLLGLAAPYTASDVTGVSVSLYELTPAEALVATVPTLAPAAFATPLVFRHLLPARTYRVRGSAYRNGVAISEPSPSYTDISVGWDDAPAMARLPIKLADTPFDGSVTGALTLVPGGLGGPSPSPAFFQAGYVTLLGGGAAGDAVGSGGVARFSTPRGAAVLTDGSFLVFDSGNNRLKRLAPDGRFTNHAGTGAAGSTDHPGNPLLAKFNTPKGGVVAPDGTIYVADSGNNVIRRIDAATGAVTTLAGAAGVTGTTDGTGSAARFNTPSQIVLDAAGTLYVTDYGNNTVRKVVPTVLPSTGSPIAGMVTTIATGISSCYGIVLAPDGDLRVAAAVASGLIRRVPTSPASGAPPLAYVGGAGAPVAIPSGDPPLNTPLGLALDPAGNLYVADSGNNAIRMVPSGGTSLRTLVSGAAGAVNGPLDVARLKDPVGLAFSGRMLLIAERNGNAIRGLLLPN